MGSVLIIDAEEDFAQRLADEVRAHGVEPTLTSDGKAGLDMAHINIPDAIVLCVELPRMSGYSICAKLKKDATLKGVPLIITSAEATQETFEHHKKLKTRAEEYLKKPFEPDVLVELLRNYVDVGPKQNGTIPTTLQDDEAFSADETIAMSAGDMPPGALDSAIEQLEQQPPPLGLEGGAGLKDRFEEDELMTTVGRPPMEDANSSQDLADLKKQLQTEREARANAERERDIAIANEKAAAAQAQAMNASTPPTAAQQSRELLEVKKQLNAKEHELLELGDKVHDKDKQIVALRDKEMELEGRVVQAQEDAEAADQARVEAEGKIAAAETRAAELEKSSSAQIEDLNRQLSQAAAHEAELDGALNSKLEEVQALTDTVAERDAEIAEHKRTQQTLNAEITRVSNELSASTAESDSLRQQLSDKEVRVAELSTTIDGLELDVENKKTEIRTLQGQLRDAEDRASRAYARIREDEETRAKTREALAIAVSLLQESEPSLVDADDVIEEADA
ncbi:MAG: response regulator [Deltaproteobacteria bacterium]